MHTPIKYVFFGSSRFSEYVLDELKNADLFPALDIRSAREDLPLEELRALNADFFVVASFGKILPKEILEMPKHGCINVHPSLLPAYRGPSPIQNQILDNAREVGVTIIKMDEQMDHGPILAQEKIEIAPFPDHYDVVEEKLGRAGGKLLAEVLENELKEIPQDDSQATYVKMIKKEDGLLNLSDAPETNVRKVLAYSTWPGAYLFHKRKDGKEIRVVVKDAKVENGIFTPTSVIPAGKKEMSWDAFLKGNA